MANTDILIKRSEVTSIPPSIKYGELAYSFASNTLYIGANSASNNVPIIIGGQSFINDLNTATNLNVNSTIVKRDANGDFIANNIIANLQGTSDYSRQLSNAFTLTITGDGSSNTTIDGSSNVSLNLILNTINSNTGTFGGSLDIPVINVNDKGLITSITNTAISVSIPANNDISSLDCGWF